jgi:tetratricopeptide (TPR) repeat protein
MNRKTTRPARSATAPLAAWISFTIALGFAMLPALVRAQPPSAPAGGAPRPGQPRGGHDDQPFKNLKVLPKDISQDDLRSTMRAFNQALGVRCIYCHVGEEGKPLDTFDFAADTKENKQIARTMLQMAGDINGKWIAKLAPAGKESGEHEAPVTVRCATCHHGLAVPRSMQDTFSGLVAEQGVEPAIRKYRELRDTYYGRDSYDFSDAALNDVARSLLGDKKTADAIAVLDLNAEFNPKSSMTQALLGEAQMQAGDKEKATAAYQHALELNPQNEFAKRRLAELTGAAPK